MQRACGLLAQQAESLAGEIERGEIDDRGGTDALRLLPRLVRVVNLPNQAACLTVRAIRSCSRGAHRAE